MFLLSIFLESRLEFIILFVGTVEHLVINA